MPSHHRSTLTNDETDDLLHRFGDFHDGVLHEAHLWAEHWVADNLAMHIGVGLDTRVHVVLQRQWRPVSAIELLFEEVTRCNVIPSPETHTGFIWASTLLTAYFI